MLDAGAGRDEVAEEYVCVTLAVAEWARDPSFNHTPETTCRIVPGTLCRIVAEIPCGSGCGALGCELVFPSLAAAVDEVLGLDPDTLGDAELTRMLDDIRRSEARLVAARARLVAAADARRTFAPSGHLNTPSWLADRNNTPVGDAHADVRLARRLRTMPATRASLAAGTITARHAHTLAGLNAPATAGAFAQAEEFLVGQARTMRWADFTRAMAYWRREARCDDADKHAKSDWEHRSVSLHDGLRGTGLLAGELTPLAKATLAGALAPIERELFEADWADAKAIHGAATTTAHLARTPRQRRHDALVELANRAATAPAGGKRPAPLFTVMLGYGAFKNVCELADGTILAPSEVASVLDDAMIERIIFDGPSRVLDIGEARFFRGARRRAIEVTDRHCQGPGCHTTADRCEVDHRWRASDGGPTIQENGELRCGPHNRQRERPPPKPIPDKHPPPETTPEKRADHLETLRARVRDQCLHNPRHGWVPIDDP
jgi:hypothetical protein